MLESTESEPISTAERTEMWAQMRKRQGSWDTERAELLKVIEDLQTHRRGDLEPDAPVNESTHVNIPDLFEQSSEHGQVDSIEQIMEVAEYLRIDLVASTGPEQWKFPRVDFNQFPISWPWAFSAEAAAASGLMPTLANRLKGKIIAELEILMLHAIREDRWHPHQDPWTQFPPNMHTQSLRWLVTQDFVNEQAGRPEISSNGRVFLAWLGRIGFEFIYTSDRQAQEDLPANFRRG